MRKNLIILFFATAMQNIFAQGAFTLPQTIVAGKTYNCKVDDNTISIHNASKPYMYPQTKSKDFCRSMSYNDGEEVIRIINSTILKSLTQTRINALKALGEDRLVVVINFDNEGVVKIVNFRLKKDTHITPTELAKLEDDLLAMQFVVPAECKGKFEYIGFNYYLHFNKLNP